MRFWCGSRKVLGKVPGWFWEDSGEVLERRRDADTEGVTFGDTDRDTAK